MIVCKSSNEIYAFAVLGGMYLLYSFLANKITFQPHTSLLMLSSCSCHCKFYITCAANYLVKNVGGLCLRDDFAASIGIYRTVSAIYTHQGHNMELIWYFYIVNDNTRAPEARAKKIGPSGCF